MPSIDERVVAMAFENQVFETRVAQTISTLGKLDTAVKNIGNTKGFDDIEKSGNKVTLNGPMSALDKLRAKLSRSGDGAAQGFSDIEKASSKVTLEGTGKAIDKTQAKLDNLSAGQTFSDIERDSGHVSLQGLASALDSVTSKFSVLSGAAAVALGNITTQAVSKGANFAKSFGVGPIIDGLHEYETNLKSIQTIQANTDQPLTKINASLNQLNHYSDQTIYNFSEMARNIGTFTAAGVDLKTATSSIKGIANMAALSGSSSQQAATAMYQLSQAISSGRVGLQDWNSVVNAGMGGKKLQSALAQTSIAMGNMKDSSVKLEGPMKKLTINGQSFRESIQSKPGQKPWLTSEVLVNTLATLDGRFSKAALSAELTKDGLKKYTAAQIEAKIADNRAALEKKNGVKYSDAQFKSLMHLSDSAFKSATEVKTLGQVFDVAKETIGSGWGASFQSIFGTLTEAKTTFTGLSNTINGFINATSLARNTVLHDWKEMGGRTVLIEGIKQAFQNLFAILKPIKDAFRDIFPAKTGKDLFAMTKSFADLMQNLKPSKETIDGLRRTFAGFFAVVHIGWSIVKGLVGVIADLLGTVGKGSGGFLSFTGGIGDFLVAVDSALTKGGLLKGFFATLTNVLKQPLNAIMNFASTLLGIFGFADKGEEFGKKVGDSMGALPAKLAPLKPYLDKAAEAWRGFLDILKKVAAFLTPWVDKFKSIANDVVNAIAGSFTQVNFDNVIKAVQTGLLGGLFLQIRKIMSKGIGVDVGGGFLKKLGGTFQALTGQLQAMQKNVQAGILLKIAAALGLLAAAAFIFSTIPADKLAKAMGAMAIGLAQMVAGMALMSKLIGGKGMLSLPVMATGVLLLSGAMLILATAVKIFATMKWDELARGLAGLGGGLAIIAVGLKFMGPGTLVQGPALIGIAIALNLLAGAVKQMASLSWEELGKGLAGIGVGLGLILGAMALMPPNMAVSSLGLIGMSIGVSLLAAAVAAMGTLDVTTIAKGIVGISLAMVALAVAVTAFPPTLALQAAGLLILGAALSGIAGAIGVMGSLSIGKLVKGLAAMGIALAELAVGLYLMIGSAPGAVALLAAAAAFAVLGPALAVMGNLEWSTILKGLATMALTMGLLALAGVALAVPLALIGAALLVLGVGLLPVALSAMLLAKAFQILGAEGAKGVAVLIAAVGLFVASIPKMIVGFLQGIGDVLTTVAELAPKLAIAIGIVVNALLFALAEAIPKAGLVISRLLTTIVGLINQNSQPLIQAGIGLLLNFLTGVSQNISKVVQTASNIVVKFLTGLRNNAPRLTASGLSAMLAFLTGISTGIPRIVNQVADMVSKFLSTVTTRLPGLVTKGAEMVIKFINGIASKIGDIVDAGAHFIGKFLVGIGNAIPDIVKKGLFVARRFLNGLADGMSGLADIGFKAIIRFLNGLEASIRENSDDLFKAGAGIVDAIVDGMTQQFGKAGGILRHALESVFSLLPGWAKRVLGIKSPSREFAAIGKSTVEGFAVGVVEHRMKADRAVADMAKGTMQTFSKAVIDRRMGPVSQFKEVGRQSMRGLKQGIEEGKPEVTGSMFGLAGGLVQSLKDTLQIKSPSQVFKDIGKEVSRGFAEGIVGSQDEIRNAFQSMRDRIRTEMKTERDAFRDNQKEIRQLNKDHADKLAEIRDLKKHPNKNKQAIKDAQAEARDIEAAINRSAKSLYKHDAALAMLQDVNAHLGAGLKGTRDELLKDAAAMEGIQTRLDKAQQALDSIISDRDSFIKSMQDKFATLPEFDKESKDPVADYKQKLADQVEATKKFYETMKTLRAQGVDDVTLKKIFEGGLDNAGFAEALVGNSSAIASINELDTELGDISKTMADDLGTSLYKAGITAAQGLVDGIQAEKDKLEAVMAGLAKVIVDTIKADLGIKSPSKVMAELGQFVMSGFAGGINKGAPSVENAAQNAVDIARRAFESLSTDGLVDVDPTITPVLDLTQLEKDAQKLGDLTNVTPITAAASFGQASAISGEQSAAAAEAAAQAGGNVTQVEFTQYNTSPESLSDTEIYRQTNNQLSQLRSVLGLTPKS